MNHHESTPCHPFPADYQTLFQLQACERPAAIIQVHVAVVSVHASCRLWGVGCLLHETWKIRKPVDEGFGSPLAIPVAEALLTEISRSSIEIQAAQALSDDVDHLSWASCRHLASTILRLKLSSQSRASGARRQLHRSRHGAQLRSKLLCSRRPFLCPFPCLESESS